MTAPMRAGQIEIPACSGRVAACKSFAYDVLELTVAERLKPVEAILDRIAEAPNATVLTDEQRVELDRRLEGYERNPDEGSLWPEVKARILKRS